MPAIKFSFLIQSYRMKREVLNTLASLQPAYQDANRDIYEVVLVENPSTPSQTLTEADLADFEFNLRFIANTENVPVTRSLNNGMKQCRGDYLIVCIDGARILSEGILKYCHQGTLLSERAIVAFHAFHLGRFPQQWSQSEGLYSKQDEIAFLKDIGFPKYPRSLFNNACWAGSSKRGYFSPMAESNCLMLPRSVAEAIGGFDERLDTPSGGIANLDLYRRALLEPDTRLFHVLGEGSFHQLHDGDTTTTPRKFGHYIREYEEKTGQSWRMAQKPFEFLGHMPNEALALTRQSVVRTTLEAIPSRPAPILANIEAALADRDRPVDLGRSHIQVLAIHRTKSSYITGQIRKAVNGIVPGTLLGGNLQSNEKGHFEPPEVVIFNNRLLSWLGSHWRSIAPLDFGDRSAEEHRNWVRQIELILDWGRKQHLETPEDAERPLVIKDPRLCRLAPVYDSLYAGAACKTKRVFILDHPAKVARSLYRRNAMNEEWGELLWLRYTHDMLKVFRSGDLLINAHTVTRDALRTQLSRYLDADVDVADYKENSALAADSEIAKVFEDYCRSGDLKEFTCAMAAILSFIDTRPGLFSEIDSLVAEIS
jgi:hypothetical protein